MKLLTKKNKQENLDKPLITQTEYNRIEEAYIKRLRELKGENKILKKAMHNFTNNR